MRTWKVVILILLAAAVLTVGIAAGLFFFLPQKEEVILHLEPIVTYFKDLPRNELDKDAFSRENGFLHYGDNSLTGVDVSSHQGNINWAAVKKAGVDFAIIRAAYRGYTAGGLNMDPYFVQNIEGAKAAGLQVGIYLFSQAISAEEAKEEAEFVLQCLDGRALDLPIYFDWEYVEGDSRTKNIGSDVVTAAAEMFCGTVSKAGYDAGIYFNKSLGYSVLKLDRLKNYEFWLAEYLPEPTFFFAFTTLQYTDSGTVPGISTKVDLNLRFSE